MAQLYEQLPVLERGPSGREIRVAVELLMDTGRRPAEILRLPLDCLTRDPDNAAVLIYDNHKRDRRERRLPISQATAAAITTQQQRVRERFPDTPLAELVLLPSPHANPTGARSLSGGLLDLRHRDWVDQLPVLRRAEGTEFDRAKIVPYAYRHTYVISPGLNLVRDVGHGGGRARASRVSGTRLCRWLPSPRDRVDQRRVPGRAGGVAVRRRRVVGGARR
jgi:integrase